MLKIALCIKDGVIVNTASYDEETSKSWLEAVKSDFDEIILVDENALEPPAPEPVEPTEPVEQTELEN
jgi:hypothetical protein